MSWSSTRHRAAGMFDANGQLVPDEILALRIETHDTDEENDD